VLIRAIYIKLKFWCKISVCVNFRLLNMAAYIKLKAGCKMNKRKILGYAMIAVPGLAVLIACGITFGWWHPFACVAGGYFGYKYLDKAFDLMIEDKQ